MSHNNPRVLDSYQQAKAVRNANAVNRALAESAPAGTVVRIVQPFLNGPILWRFYAAVTRKAFYREGSKYPLPVSPSKQTIANARRLRQRSLAA